jgi:4-amino-4-deoxy-L-arabinose transferase-like glycosyltransferase
MWQRGDWVTPMFNAELRGQKPVLTYWLMMSALAVFGEGEFAVRFWSAALGVGTVVLTYLWVRHLFFARLARWAGLILSTTLMFTLASRAATPDAPLIFFSTLAITLYVLGTFRATGAEDWEGVFAVPLDQRLRRPGRWFPATPGALAIYAAMSLGVLAKGPVAVVLPTIIIGLFILIESSRTATMTTNAKSRGGWQKWIAAIVARLWAIGAPRRFCAAVGQMQPWWLVGMVMAISLPWFVWVGWRTDGEFLRLFFLREHLERATTAMEGHRGGVWFYPLAIVCGVFPWSILVVPAGLCWIGLQRTYGLDPQGQRRWAGGLTLAMVWVGLQVAVFTAASTKLPSYVTPCYPAVALLLAIVPTELAARRLTLRPIWLRAGFATWLLIGTAVAVGIYYALPNQLGWPAGWLPALGGVLVVGGGLVWIVWERGSQPWVARGLCVTSWLFVWLTFGYATAYVSKFRTTDDLWRIAAEQQRSGAVLAGFRDLESTWVFYAQQPIWELDPDSPPAVSGSAGPDPLQREHWWSVKPRASVQALLEHYPGSLIVTPEKHLDDLMARLPAEYGSLAVRPDFLSRSNLVLVGPLPEATPEVGSTTTTAGEPTESRRR